MFKKNKRHIQPPLISEVSQLPEGQFQRLKQSWRRFLSGSLLSVWMKVHFRVCILTCLLVLIFRLTCW